MFRDVFGTIVILFDEVIGGEVTSGGSRSSCDLWYVSEICGFSELDAIYKSYLSLSGNLFSGRERSYPAQDHFERIYKFLRFLEFQIIY